MIARGGQEAESGLAQALGRGVRRQRARDLNEGSLRADEDLCFLVVLGVFSFRDLGVDLFPRSDPATVNISISLPGATPEEMATQVVLPIEEAVNTISGLDEISSQTSEGTARITCTFVLERDLEGAAQDVREKVSGALRYLPPNIYPPVIQKADPDSAPVLTISVVSDKNIRETTEIADKQIRRVLETVDGVGTVTMGGGRSRAEAQGRLPEYQTHAGQRHGQPNPVVYDNVRIDTGFKADLVIDDKVIVEIKSVDLIPQSTRRSLRRISVWPANGLAC